MKITTSFLHLEHTPALDEKIKETSAKLEKFFQAKGTIKWSCYVKNGEHFAEIYFHAPHCDYHAKACSENLYQSIDMAAEKIEKQAFKKKDKYNKIHKEKSEIVILDPADAWMDHDEEDVA
ncbi:MAG: ribosome hibernation-promoting factor, HPF/YfiA family [Bacteriovorax sp.]